MVSGITLDSLSDGVKNVMYCFVVTVFVVVLVDSIQFFQEFTSIYKILFSFTHSHSPSAVPVTASSGLHDLYSVA
jgi:hypothetical protein